MLKTVENLGVVHCKNKYMRQAYRNYCDSCYYYLGEVYGTYSYKKENAMTYCKNLQKDLDGWDGRICSYSIHQFTYGFEFLHFDEKLGKYRNAFCYITKSYNRWAYIEEVNE